MTSNGQWIAILALGGLLAAPAGWANDHEKDETRQNSREQAREATETAAREAAAALQNDTRVELDIRLIGPTSLKVAAERLRVR